MIVYVTYSIYKTAKRAQLLYVKIFLKMLDTILEYIPACGMYINLIHRQDARLQKRRPGFLLPRTLTGQRSQGSSFHGFSNLIFH